jgi:hypothetical protein
MPRLNHLLYTFLIAGGAAFLGSTLGAPPASALEASFVGSKKCKVCHKKEDVGNQYGQWQKTAHAHAYQTLGSDKAKEKAKTLGIDDPQKSPKCLKCHITAFPVMDDLANQKITLEEGVSCESCHGAGSLYKKKKTMKGIAEGKIDRATVGLTKPDETVCKKCHNSDNPFDNGFDFETAYKEIAHERPNK